MTAAKIVKVDPLHPQEQVLKEAGDVIRRGGLAIIPTETVYGIAANMLDKRTVTKLCEIKQRPLDKPFSLHLADVARVEDFAVNIPPAGYKLMEAFWPGPLTLVFHSKGGPTIGIRIPDHEVALQVIRFSNVEVLCPSANLAGKPAPVTFEQAIRDLGEVVDFAIDAGPTRLGMESSVVDLTQSPARTLREAALKTKAIEAVISKKTVLFVCTGNSCRSVMAEALLKRALQAKKRYDVQVSSAGILLLSGMGATEQTKAVLSQDGIDVSGHRSQKVIPAIIKKTDIVLVMEKLHEDKILQMVPEAKNRVFLLKEFARIDDNDFSIVDPVGKNDEFYAFTYALIKQAVERIADIL